MVPLYSYGQNKYHTPTKRCLALILILILTFTFFLRYNVDDVGDYIHRVIGAAIHWLGRVVGHVRAKM